MRQVGQAKVVGLYASACWLIATGGCGLDWTVPERIESPSTNDAGGQAPAGVGTGALADQAGGSGPGGAAGATSSTADAAATSGSSGGGGAPTCDVASCEHCDECALEKDCAASFQACNDDPPCSPMSPSCCVEVDACVYGDGESWQCAGNLADTECIEACYDWIYYTRESVQLHQQLMQCILCDACPTTCADYQQAVWLGGC